MQAATLYDGRPAPYVPGECPNRGRIMFWASLDGRNADALTLYCQLCGVGIAREPYPEEARFHP